LIAGSFLRYRAELNVTTRLLGGIMSGKSNARSEWKLARRTNDPADLVAGLDAFFQASDAATQKARGELFDDWCANMSPARRNYYIALGKSAMAKRAAL
jgi:hypothetical protein